MQIRAVEQQAHEHQPVVHQLRPQRRQLPRRVLLHARHQVLVLRHVGAQNRVNNELPQQLPVRLRHVRQQPGLLEELERHVRVVIFLRQERAAGSGGLVSAAGSGGLRRAHALQGTGRDANEGATAGAEHRAEQSAPGRGRRCRAWRAPTRC